MNSYTDKVELSKPADRKTGSHLAARPGPSARTQIRRRALTSIALLVAALILGFGSLTLWQQLAPQITPPPSAESAYAASFRERSIALLPFEDLDEPSKSSTLSESIQDSLLNALSQVSDLKVTSRNSVTGYAPGKPRDLRDIAQSLGAGHLLEGKVSRAGDKIRITVQLSDARKGVQPWTATYEPALGDVFAIQSDLVPKIADQLQARLTPKEKVAIGERPTNDLAAYGLYVRGMALVSNVASGQIQERLQQAVELLNQAVARDPDFYLAYCQLAVAHDFLYFFGFDHSPARLALAKSALDTIIRLHPDAGETHLARATFFYRCYLDFDKARAELLLTQQDLPNASEAFEVAGYIDRRQGLWTESARSLQRAIKLDPRNVYLLGQIAASYEEFRQFGAMAAALDRALDIAPHDLDSRITRSFIDLAWRADTLPLRQTIDALLIANPDLAGDLADQWLYLGLCERDPATIARALAAIPATGVSTDMNFPRAYCEALAARAQGDKAGAQKAFLAARVEVEKTAREQPDYGPVYTVLGLIDAGLGRKEEAIREGRRALELLPVSKDSIDGAEVMKYLAIIYAWCGEKDLALEQIAATLRIPSTLSYGRLKLHPYWDTLRGDPRFEKIVADLAPKS